MHPIVGPGFATRPFRIRGRGVARERRGLALARPFQLLDPGQQPLVIPPQLLDLRTQRCVLAAQLRILRTQGDVLSLNLSHVSPTDVLILQRCCRSDLSVPRNLINNPANPIPQGFRIQRPRM